MNATALNLLPAPVDFDEPKHTYTLRSNGKLVPGVTSITKNLDKPFLVPWAAKEVVTFLEPLHEQIKAATPKEYAAILKEAKGAHKRKAQTAMDHGTLAHKWIEAYLAESLGLPAVVHAELTTEAQQAVNAFQKWEWANKITWLASELVVGSEEHEYGGKFDAIAEIDGKVTLIDFKTSSQISEEYYLQTAGYQIALEEMGGRVDQRLILRIDKKDGTFDPCVVKTPLDLDKEAFLSLRQVQRWQAYLAARGKAA